MAQRTRDTARQDRVPAAWLDAAGALYLTAVRSADKHGGALDKKVAAFLKEHRGLGDEGRGFVVDTAQGMMRARRRLDAAVKELGFEPTRGALAGLYLVGARGVDVRTLPIDPRGGADLAKAWSSTDALPLDVRASLPRWLVDELRAARPPDADDLCLALGDAPPTALRANRLKATPPDVVAALLDDDIPAHVGSLSPDAVVLDERANVFRTRAFREGLFEMQDEGSQLVSLVCEAKPGMVVVDGCAGAGGKTLHLAAIMEGKGQLLAFDTSSHRLEALSERARRAGAHNVRVHDLHDGGAAVRKRWRDRADVVLVDAPCSGTGVLRRNPDTSWKLESTDVDRMREQQREILDAYAALVKPGGRLVYATCSLLPRENQGTVDAFLARHPDFRVTPVEEIFARQGVVVPGVGDVLQLDPLRHGTDGFFACALTRAG
jgi:16S rRNA (cytosine967-C5)-methyltransferase